MIKATSWLLLLFSLPTNRNTERVAVWRRLKKMGAVQIKTSTYLLPDEAAQYEQFQWLAQQIRDYGGDSGFGNFACGATEQHWSAATE